MKQHSGKLILAGVVIALLLLLFKCEGGCSKSSDTAADASADTTATQETAPAATDGKPTAAPSGKQAGKPTGTTGTDAIVKGIHPAQGGKDSKLKVMYRGCNNLIAVNGTGLTGGLSVVASQAGVVPKGGYTYSVIPSGETCTVTVSQDGQKLYEETYRVVDAPRPELVLAVNGQTIDRGAEVSLTDEMELRVIADPDFRLVAPEEARYQITNAVVKGQNGIQVPRPVAPAVTGQTRETMTIVLSADFKKKLKAGDRFYVQADKVNRLGSSTIPEVYSVRELTYDLIVK